MEAAKLDRQREFLLNRIFEEVKQADTNRHYIEMLLDKQILNSRYFNIGIVIISTAGAVVSLLFSDGLWAIIASGSIAIGTMLNQLHPIFFLRSEDVAKLSKLHTETYNYCNRLQDLFCLADANKVSPEEAQTEFRRLTEDNSSKTTDISKIFGKMKKGIQGKAISKNETFIFRIYGVPTTPVKKRFFSKFKKEKEVENQQNKSNHEQTNPNSRH